MMGKKLYSKALWSSVISLNNVNRKTLNNSSWKYNDQLACVCNVSMRLLRYWGIFFFVECYLETGEEMSCFHLAGESVAVNWSRHSAGQCFTCTVLVFSYTDLCSAPWGGAYRSVLKKKEGGMVVVAGKGVGGGGVEKANCCSNVLHHSNEPITTFLHPIKRLAPLATFMTLGGQNTSSLSSATQVSPSICMSSMSCLPVIKMKFRHSSLPCFYFHFSSLSRWELLGCCFHDDNSRS